MKKISLFIAILGFVLTSKAQTADEIISKYFKTVGGIEKINSITGVKMKAKVDQMGMTIPLEIYYLKTGQTITKISFQGMEMAQGAFDGTTAWGTNFMTMKPEKSEAEDTENMKRATKDFFSPLMDYSSKGYKLELLGEETIEGAKCFKLKLTKNTVLLEGREIPNIEYYYFDKENFVPVVMETEISSGQMKGQIAQTLFSDYQDVSGILFPFSLTQKLKDQAGQTIVFEAVELNPVVDLKMFAFPEQ